MINSNYIIICDQVVIDGATGKLDMLGVFDIINSPGFPAMHKHMAIVINVDLDAKTYREKVFIKKDGKTIGEIPETEMKKDSPGKHRFIHNLNNIPFPDEGGYDIEAYLDGILIGSTRLVLKKI